LISALEELAGHDHALDLVGAFVELGVSMIAASGEFYPALAMRTAVIGPVRD
jgi:hypothetical protein